jgi:glycine betaine catabolism A
MVTLGADTNARDAMLAEPGPYAPDHEDGIRQFVDWYCRTMQRGLGDAQASISRVA